MLLTASRVPKTDRLADKFVLISACKIHRATATTGLVFRAVIEWVVGYPIHEWTAECRDQV